MQECPVFGVTVITTEPLIGTKNTRSMNPTFQGVVNDQVYNSRFQAIENQTFWTNGKIIVKNDRFLKKSGLVEKVSSTNAHSFERTNERYRIIKELKGEDCMYDLINIHDLNISLEVTEPIDLGF